MILPLDIFTLIIEELVATIPDLYYPLIERNPRRQSFGGWTGEDIQVLKAVKADAQKALKATCLTCRALVPFCQRGIFASIRFESRPVADEKWRMIARLDRLLQQSPHLSEYIRNVYFADDSRDYPKSNLISRVLLKLHDVRVFDLDQGCYSGGGNWRQFPDSIAFAIGTIIQLPSLRVLRMSHIKNVPPEFIRGIPQLRRLILCHCSWSKSPSANTAKPNTVELSARSSASQKINLIQTVIESADPSIVQPIFGPKTLAVDIASDEDVIFVWKLMKIAGTLRHLQWSIQQGWTSAGLSKVLSTGISQTLTTLSLFVGAQYPHAGHPCFGLDVEIWLVPVENVLQSISFTFHYPYQVAFHNMKQFHEIDKAITRDRFPCLTEIRFHFILSHMGNLDHDHSSWLQRYRTNFPLLSLKKDIDFQCSLETLGRGRDVSGFAQG